MNNTDEITQLNEMLKRVEKLVSNLPETEQMMYQSMIKAKPDSLEHLKTIEQIAQNNIADSVTDHDFDDYIPDTFHSGKEKAEENEQEVKIAPEPAEAKSEPTKPTSIDEQHEHKPNINPEQPARATLEEKDNEDEKKPNLMGICDLKQLSQKLKNLGSKQTIQKPSPSLLDDEGFEALEKEFNEFEGAGQSMEASFGISRMMERARAEAIFGMDIVKIKDHPSSNQRYFRLQDGSVAKETLDSFQIKTHDIRKNIDTIVAVAKEKGWKKIELNGGRAYIEQMYLAARKEGLLVKPVDETQKFLFEQLDKRFKLNEQKQQKNEDDSISIKNVEEELEVKNASEKKNKP